VENNFINLKAENIATEHLCCAISDKKHQAGVSIKRSWLLDRINEGHIFRKLNAHGKIFIEYAPLEKAWVPIIGENYIYIYCLWVSGSYKNKGYGTDLLNYCISDAKSQAKSGLCILSSKVKKPFVAEKKFMAKFGFKTADTYKNEYELLALSFDGTMPSFTANIQKTNVHDNTLTIYYGLQCPLIPDCIKQIEIYCNTNNIPLNLIKIDHLDKAKELSFVFNNWTVFYKGEFKNLSLLNGNILKKMIEKWK